MKNRYYTSSRLLNRVCGITTSSKKSFSTQDRYTRSLCRTGTRILSEEERSVISLKIVQAGLNIKPEWFQGLKMFLAGVVVLLCVPLMLISFNFLFLLPLALVLYLLPNAWLNSKRKARQSNIRRSLSEFTLLLSTVLTSGVNLITGLKEASNATGGPLRDEVERAIKNHMVGENLIDALANMAKRTDVDDLNSLVRTLNQASVSGSSLAETMQSHSEQMRLVRKFETMEQAGKLSVTMIFPVMIFILIPCMMVFGYPAMYALMRTF